MIHVSPRELYDRALPPAWTEADDRWSEMVIFDVSEDGFNLKGVHALQPGELIEVWWGAFSVVGEVRWSRGDECGVRTLEPLALEQLRVGQLTSHREAAIGGGTVQLRPIDSGHQRERNRQPRMTGAAFTVVVAAGALASALVVAILRA